MLKEKLTQLQTALTNLKTKLATKLQTLQQKTNTLNQANQKLELQAKETAESEKVLDQLLKEMQELERSL
jgi:hypothetical protein